MPNLKRYYYIQILNLGEILRVLVGTTIIMLFVGVVVTMVQ
jgi:hypothetical protein